MNDAEAATRSDESQADEQRPSEGGLPDPDEMSQEEIDEIEAERKRRLDPDNRPDMAEVDNTDLEFDFEREELVDADELARESRAESSADGEGSRTPAQGGLPPLEEIPQEEIDEIEAERQRRLDPENRPDMAEVDNTQREFDLERGEFVDSPDEDAAAEG
ncbi:MAG TPA: hypothetical protein VF165_21825 [Nocardioidaceae bacterium]